MENFYLPIKIGQRRMHICHLNNPRVDYGFEFIIPTAGNDIELFSFSHDAKLISTNGIDSNKIARNIRYKVECLNNVEDSLNVKLIMENVQGEFNDKPLDDDKIGISMSKDSQNNFVAKATKLISVKKLNITICYKENNKSFEYSFVIHIPKENEYTKIYKAAIDFGSEASQVAFQEHASGAQPQFIKLVDTLKEFYKQHSSERLFWQGKSKDTDPETSRLFKSVFFVNKNPDKGYTYADEPNRHEKHTILQTITPQKFDPNFYDSLFLLPNLKLVELLSDRNFLTDEMLFSSSQTNPRGYRGRVNILSNDLIEDFIRMILNNLLYAILKTIGVETKSKKYLHITLLMPNVYSQEKVYRLIQNFYKDFKEIVKSLDYEKFIGIEVQAMSESDASFIGTRMSATIKKDKGIKTENFANYLVIDAGKGTTDFSIIKQQESSVKYDSQLRTGLPGSGQMLSYAFIESIAKMLTGIDLLDLIKKETEYPEILIFMEYVEQFKKSHTLFGELDINSLNEPEKKNYQSKFGEDFSKLEQVNIFIKDKFIDKKIRIPDSDNNVKQKVEELVDRIEENILYSGITSFHQVILAGRAFRFKPFFDAVEKRFTKKVTAENNFIFEDSEAKFNCIKGSFQSEFIHINLNSELIGSPVILDSEGKLYNPSETKNNPSETKRSTKNHFWKKIVIIAVAIVAIIWVYKNYMLIADAIKWVYDWVCVHYILTIILLVIICVIGNWVIKFVIRYIERARLTKMKAAKLTKMKAANKFIDEEFFYNGMELNFDLKDKIIRIGARNYPAKVDAIYASTAYTLFYTGDGFVLLWKNGSSPLEDNGLPKSFPKMVEETLFPFAYINFGNPPGTNSTAHETAKEKIVEKSMAVKPHNSNETENLVSSNINFGNPPGTNSTTSEKLKKKVVEKSIVVKLHNSNETENIVSSNINFGNPPGTNSTKTEKPKKKVVEKSMAVEPHNSIETINQDSQKKLDSDVVDLS